jgi:Fe-S cluster assembly protein SufD
MSAAADSLSTNLHAAHAALPGHELAWLSERRAAALSSFDAMGFPSVRHEDWKYTNVRNIERRAFECSKQDADTQAIAAAIKDFGYDVTSQIVAPLVDGYPRQDAVADATARLPDGVTLLPLASAIADPAHAQIVRAHLGQVANAGSDGFAALNAASLAEGYYLHLAAGVQLQEPVTILVMAISAQESAMNPRHLIVLERDASAHVVEHCVTVNRSASLHNTVTEVALLDGARLEHTKLQVEAPVGFHVATLEAHVGAGAKFVSHAMSAGSAISRYDINVHLNGDSAACVLNGLYLGSGRQHVDFHTRIHHAKPNCTSEQLYKGILGGSSRGVFNGQVHVHQDAQKSDAQQANHNLLLSRNAEIDTKPQLEILADDVKCSHGTTVGQIDQGMLFYLRSRGVPETQARGLLTFGFAHDLVDRLSVPAVAARMEKILLETLPHGDELKALVEE